MPLIGLQQALSTDAADAGGFYSLSFSSLRLGSDSKARASWLTPTAISLRMQHAFYPLRLSLSFNLLESYHSILKLSTRKVCPARKNVIVGRTFLSWPPLRGGRAAKQTGGVSYPRRDTPTTAYAVPLPRWGRQGGYSLFRMILPEMVLGSSSRNSTIRGYL